MWNLEGGLGAGEHPVSRWCPLLGKCGTAIHTGRLCQGQNPGKVGQQIPVFLTVEVLRLVRGPGGVHGGWGGTLQSMQPRRGDGHWEDLGHKSPSCACPG